MRIPQGKVTNALVIATGAIWLALTLGGYEDLAAGAGGFFSARLSGALVLEGALPAWLTPLSAAFLHADIFHLAFNMLMLFYCGRFVEAAIGPTGLGVLYVIGAYASAAAEYLWDPVNVVPMIGASGAISAIVGCYAMLFGQNRIRPLGPIPARIIQIVWLAAAWIVIQGLIGVATWGSMTRIAIVAHIGGFIPGLLLARPLLLWRYRKA